MTIQLSPTRIRPTRGIPAEAFAIGVLIMTAAANALHLVI